MYGAIFRLSDKSGIKLVKLVKINLLPNWTEKIAMRSKL